MWAAGLVALMVGGPFGACLLLAAGITQFIKVTKVDAKYAEQGKTPPSYALVQKWLDSRAAKGAKPQKIAKPGMWRYAWQRWQAMWEDLSEKHQEVREQYKQAAAAAKARGDVPPPEPTFRETLSGWRWHIDQLTAPAAVRLEETAPGPSPAEVPLGEPERDRDDDEPRRPARQDTSRAGSRTDDWLLEYVPFEEPYTLPASTAPVTDLPSWETRRGLYNLGPRPCIVCEQPGRVVERADGRTFVHDRTGDRCPAIEPAPTDRPNPAGTTTEGDPMTQTIPQQSGEVTGLMSAINYADAVAAAHDAHSAGGGEQYRAALGQAQVGPETIASAARAQEATEIAAAAWREHGAKLREQLAAKEATTAETGRKEFLLAE